MTITTNEGRLYMSKLYRSSFFLSLTLLIVSTTCLAALPGSVNGAKLPSLAPMVKRVIPAIVDITSIGRKAISPNRLFNIPGRYNRSQNRQYRRTRSLGAGVIVNAKKGYILTNNHVVAKATKINVVLHDGRKLKAKLIGRDPESDIAVIQIDAKNLKDIKLGNSDLMQVGDFVVAIGNPYGLGQTVTSGIISALGRTNLGIVGYEDLIQTDAAINQGNSGGALINLRGELIGINTAIISKSGGSIGIGFAIPINMATKLMQQIISHGKVRRGLLGVHIQTLTPELARGFGLNKNTRGALINRVIAGSAADKAGILTGDIIIKANTKVVTSANTLRNTIGLMSVGQRVTLRFIRDRVERKATAKLGSSKTKSIASKPLHKHMQGATIANIPRRHRYYGQIKGVIITRVKTNSRAWQNNLRKGDIITNVNRRRISNLGEFKQAVLKSKKSILLNIVRGEGAIYLYLE